MAKEPVKIIYEHSTEADLEGNVYDGMWDMLGDDVLSSDWGRFPGDTWPGVQIVPLPPEWQEAMRRLDEQEAAYRAAHPEAKDDAEG